VERFDQYHRGVRVFGGDVVRDSERGVGRAVLGRLAQNIDIPVEPALSMDAGRSALLRVAGEQAFPLSEPELVILPHGGGYRLAYMGVVSARGDVLRAFVDAHTGAELLRFTEIHRQAAVGKGRGVLGDEKKMSVARQGGVYVASDQLRSPVLVTYDLRGDLSRVISVVEQDAPLFASDVAMDTDNDWTDVAAVDAHAHIGWTYDYYFKRFGRRGLDERDRPIVSLINGVSQQAALSLPLDKFDWAVNAFWCGECGPLGLMYFGNGIPPEYYFDTGQNFGYFAGALDIVAHELTHGVTDSSSRLIYLNESGALNEAFSDIMGTSVEFFYQPRGTGRGQADYIMGEDISRGWSGVNGDRSMVNPAAFGHPDHYSQRYVGTEDWGGVHINSGIANHAFYLAIEGGINRTSGLRVEGVGADNREQMEKVFYRAFVYLLPSNATFSIARAATIQAAQDLYGAGSAAERAVTQAWTAVGVF
jgi:Zn-dependent metalloprotease